MMTPHSPSWIVRHLRTLGTLLFLFAYGAAISYATPPTTPYAPGATLDPSCTPGSTNCSVQILPEQSGNANKYLTTDGSVTSWSTNTLILGGNFTTSGNYATTLTTTGTTTLTLPTTGTVATTANINSAVSGTTNYIPKFTGTNTIGNSSIYDTGTSVGVGTVTPDIFSRFYGRTLGISSTASTAIQINAATGSTAIIDFGVNATRTAGITSNTTETTIATLGATPFRFETNSLERMRITSTGNVGIGTTNPLATFHVTNTTFPQVRIQNDDTLSANGESGIRFRSQGISGTAHADIGWTGTGDDTGNFVIRVPYTMERLRITSDGNIGIGTINASEKLTVAGSISAQGVGRGLITNELRLSDYNTGIFTDGTNGNMTISSYSGGSGNAFRFVLNAAGTNPHPVAGTSLLEITKAGNIGIGTTTPNIGGVNRALTLNASAGTNASYELAINGALQGSLYTNTATTGVHLFSFVNGPLVFGTNNTTRLTIDSSGNIVIPDLAGSGNRCVYADSTGQLNVKGFDCGSASGGDNLGDHTATQNVILGTNWLSGDGGNEGIRIDASGNVGVGTGSPSAKFSINNSGSTNPAFYADIGNVSGTTVLFEHTGANTPVPFAVRKTGYSGNAQNYGILELDMGHNVVGGGSNLYFRLQDSTNSYTEYAGLGAYIVQNTDGAERGNLAFYTMDTGSGRSQKMTIQYDGNVGIGTTTPGSLLHLSSSGTDAAQLRFTNTGGGTTHYISKRTTGLNVGELTVGDGQLFIQNGGNVGIGTTSPEALLHVKSFARFDRGTLAITLNPSYSLGNVYSQVQSTGDLALAAGGDSNKVYIKSDGNVGIGTTTPGAQLTINNSSNPRLRFNVTSGENGAASGIIEFYQSNYSPDYARASIRAQRGGNSDGNLIFATSFNTNLAPQDRMIIDNNGNVGIGMTAPWAKLSTLGTVWVYNGGNTAGDITGTIFVGGSAENGGGTYATAIKTINTASTPGYLQPRMGLFTLDNNSYLPENLVERLSILPNSGNVGIGATAPGTRLEVLGSDTSGDRTNPYNLLTLTAENPNQPYDGFGGGILFKNRSYTSGIVSSARIRTSINDNSIVHYGGDIVFDVTATPGGALTPAMIVRYNSNVGIGTTSPANKLHVNGGKFILTSDSGSYGQLQVNAPAGGEATITLGSTGSGENGSGYTNVGVIGIGAYSNSRDTLVFGTGYGSGTMFLKGGNVGIGTASPSVKLDVAGAGTFSGNVTISKATAYFISNRSDNTSEAGYRYDTAGVPKWYNYMAAGDATDMLRWYYAGDKMVLTAAGSLGIGTTNPFLGQLHVNKGNAGGLGGDIWITNSGTNTVGNEVRLAFGSDNTIDSTPNASLSNVLTNTGSLTSDLVFRIYDGSGLNEKMRLTSGANLSVASLVSCGGIQTNGSGTMSCTSDETLKDKHGAFTTGLDAIRQITPESFSWKEDSGLYDNGVIYYGFIAQNVQSALPEAISTSATGKLQVSQLTLLAASINAIKELDVQVQAIPAFEDQTLYAKVAEFLRGIAERGEAVVDRVRTNTVETKELCIGEAGDQLCVNKTQLEQILLNQSATVSGGGSSNTPTPDTNTPPDEQTPEPSPEEQSSVEDETSVPVGESYNQETP